MLVEEAHVQFRHELARQAVLDAVPAGQRRRLHLDLLRVLVSREADPARIVHHAEAVADRESLATFSLRAARRAAAASAHREAHSQFRRALRFIDDLPPQERARVQEEARQHHPALAGELARWLHQAGALAGVHDRIDGPYRLELSGQWEAAAVAWAERHMPYDRALCLARSANGMGEALTVAEALGAEPLAAWLRRRHV